MTSFVLELVERSAQIRLFVLPPELLGETGQCAVLVEIAARHLADLLAKFGVAKRDEDRRDVTNELVEGSSLDLYGLAIKRPHAIEHSVAEFMIDDIGRKAGMHPLAIVVEIVELQGFAVAVVISVLAVARMRHDDQTIALKSPADTAAETRAALVEIERVLQRRPDVDLVELRRVEIVAIEDDAIVVAKDVVSFIPLAGGLIASVVPS